MTFAFIVSNPASAAGQLRLQASCQVLNSQMSTVSTNLWLANGYIRLAVDAELAGKDSSAYVKKADNEIKGMESIFRKASKQAKDPSNKQLLKKGTNYATNGPIEEIEGIVKKVQANLNSGKC
jgi:hypothetical protein